MAHKTPEMDKTIRTIRSLIISRKDPSTIRDLIKDFHEVEGGNIPYRKYGFDTLELFLESTNEFNIRRVRDNAFVTVLKSDETKHITGMLKKQKSSGRRKKYTMQRPPRSSDMSWFTRPIPTSAISPKKTFNNYLQKTGAQRNQNNNNYMDQNKFRQQNHIEDTKKSYSDRLTYNPIRNQTKSPPLKPLMEITKQNLPTPSSSLKQQSSTQPIPQQSRNNQQHHTNPTPQIIRSNSRELNQQIQQVLLDYSYGNSGPQSRPVTLIRSNSRELNQQNQQPVAQIGNSEHQLRPITRSNSRELSQPTTQPELVPNRPLSRSNSNEQNQQVTQAELVNDSTLNSKKSVKTRLNIKPLIPENEIYKNEPPRTLEITIQNKNSLQDRLRIIKQKDFSQESIRELIKTPSPPPTQQPQLQLQPQSQSVIPQTTIEELEAYCIQKKFARPAFHIFFFDLSKKYQATVTVNSVAYKTYPIEYSTKMEAYVEVSRIALEQLKQIEMRRRYPICLDSELDIAIKIYEQVLLSPNGVFRSCIPERFQLTHEQQLPDNWFSIIQKHSKFFTIEEVFNKFIIIANESAIINGTCSDLQNGFPEKLILPWAEKHWNLYITNPVSTVTIWARIIGPKYSDLMESLTTDIELSMLTDKMISLNVEVDHIYLVTIAECWYRIRVDEIKYDQCLCFFVDVGDAEWLRINELYICDNKFTKLPFQAVKFSLCGLEDFAEHPKAKSYLEEILSGKILIGEIMIKKEEYEKQEESENLEPRLQVVLYDTSSEEDVNLNPFILTKISEANVVPQLSSGDVTHVNITHITDNGDIYCQIMNDNFNYVQKLINTLIKTTDITEEQRKLFLLNENIKSKIYLIFDQNDNKWYRALIESKLKNATYKMFCIDYGMSRIVTSDNILCLDVLSCALSKFPAQAIKVQLFEVAMSDKVTARIKGLMPIGTDGMVKVKGFLPVPQVFIYIRIEEKNILLPINEILKHETEMEQTASCIWPGKRTSPENNYCSDVIEKTKQLDINTTIKARQVKSSKKKLENVIIPPVGRYYEVLVTMASNPNNFVVRPHSDGPQLHSLMTKLQTFCKLNNDFVLSKDIVVGEYYAVLHEHNSWYRAKVENIYSPSMIHICYCDYGDVTVVSNDKLKELPDEFRTLPKQAIKAKLYGIKPKYVDWAIPDCMYFQQMTVNKTFFSLVKNIKTDELCPNECIIELELIDTSGPIDEFIHKRLIDENRAISI